MRFLVRTILSLSLALLLFATNASASGDTLNSVLARAAAQRRVAVDYREVRHMQLLTKPWKASGRMFIDSDSFVMEQLKPYRQLLFTRRSLYWLYIPDKYFRRAGMVNDKMGAANFGLFQAIMRGNRQKLEQKFDVRFAVNGREWRIALHPKQSNGARYKRIVVKGEVGHAANTMKLIMSDGDSTIWHFKAHAYTAKTAKTVKALVTEARGQ